MVRIALISYLAVTKICASDEYQGCSSQRDFAVELSKLVLEVEEFPFFSLGMCKDNHDARTIVQMACRIFINILLNKCDFKRKWSTYQWLIIKKEKTAGFNLIWQVLYISRSMLWLHCLRLCRL